MEQQAGRAPRGDEGGVRRLEEVADVCLRILACVGCGSVCVLYVCVCACTVCVCVLETERTDPGRVCYVIVQKQ